MLANVASRKGNQLLLNGVFTQHCQQDQRICVQICAQMCFCVLCELGLTPWVDGFKKQNSFREAIEKAACAMMASFTSAPVSETQTCFHDHTSRWDCNKHDLPFLPVQTHKCFPIVAQKSSATIWIYWANICTFGQKMCKPSCHEKTCRGQSDWGPVRALGIVLTNKSVLWHQLNSEWSRTRNPSVWPISRQNPSRIS